ncbi:ABC transporter ATP-binding protein [Aeromicrobium alkaliterrae]|uniref:ABC transporter ATP-binding protein n=1 Tax=Aeromicrobium alkaliterrae TaxID=302168 RepID=A0ABN2K8S7_9ACTN
MSAATLLELSGLSAGYGGPDVVHDIDLSVSEGEIVTLLGANGAGKTTVLRAISGAVRSTGTVSWAGSPLRGRPDERARSGLGHVPQGRGTLTQLTVAENLWVGGARLGPRRRREAVDSWFETFPRLRERAEQTAGNLSGGEQQMLALARALISEPRLVLLDEPSLGLAPLITQEVFERLREINARLGTALLVVEQNAAASLALADRAYVLGSGHIIRHGAADELIDDDELRRAYLGA